MNILILCAGYGSRLAPLTDKIAKPLVPINGKSVLQRQLDAIECFSESRVAINAHHLAEQVESFALRLGVQKVFKEEKILGTGGPLRRAFLEGWKDDLLVMNGDVLHNFDLKKFVEQAQKSSSSFALLGFDEPKVNSVVVNSNDDVCGIKQVYGEGTETQKDFRALTFSGISWYSAEALSRIEESDFSIVSFWKREWEFLRLPKMFCADKSESWIDMGTPAGLWNAAFSAQEIEGSTQFSKEYQSKHKNIFENCIVEGNFEIPSDFNFKMKNCILLDHAKITNSIAKKHAKNHILEKAIVGEEFLWKV